ncbi:adenosyl-hopene transferase HpnH [Siccirubricoccus sp. G192]|uniref:adenosyl-hopene transferase HpnH n=1 Tax=Siccirubricoccus sp. G192 TaxID=2849651 RepID=UPI001C2CA643|nr:adenosyl-hopene transferase HpnH [Siccirubricoccus sp. G192]MBV1796933.1 adenosyl-hopene transferase HpnH [Siccirubricoccus sp. G192]
MGIPLRQQIKVGAYIVKQHLAGRKRYPLVLMLEPLFRCNLACAGCGKIDYPDAILNKRLSVQECLDAVDETGVPVVAIAGGEPLLHKEMPEIVERILARGKIVILCTNALLLEKKIDAYKPHPRFTWDIHLDGDKEQHDWAVSQQGVYDRAVAALKLAKAKGFRTAINATLFNNAEPERMARFFDDVTAMGVDAIMVSPGYAYERAPDQQHFLNRRKTKELFRGIFARGKGKRWKMGNSPLFLDFLAGNQQYHCTPWGNPTRNIFGWQRPCYLLGEGYAKTFAELMDTTDWDKYGTGNYEKCADCMVHSGFEATAVVDAVKRPWKAVAAQLRGPRTEGEMAPEIDLSNQRKADYVFSRHVEQTMAGMAHEPKRGAKHGGTVPPVAAE